MERRAFLQFLASTVLAAHLPAIEAGPRCKLLYASGTLPLLDADPDGYEAGTFAPTLEGTDRLSYQFGHFQKVGKMVHINVVIGAPALALGAKFSNLPGSSVESALDHQLLIDG